MGDKHTEEQVVFCQNSEFRGQLEMITSLSSGLFCEFSVGSESNTWDSDTRVNTHHKGGSTAVVFGKMGMLQSVILNA